MLSIEYQSTTNLVREYQRMVSGEMLNLNELAIYVRYASVQLFCFYFVVTNNSDVDEKFLLTMSIKSV